MFSFSFLNLTNGSNSKIIKSDKLLKNIKNFIELEYLLFKSKTTSLQNIAKGGFTVTSSGSEMKIAKNCSKNNRIAITAMNVFSIIGFLIIVFYT